MKEIPPPIRKVLRLLGKVLAYLFAAFVLVNLIMWAVLLIYNEDVKKFFVVRLNQQLNTKLEIDEVDLGFWKSFPEASIELKNVRMHHGKPYESAGYFLRADHVLFGFGWMDFVKGEYTARKIIIENGELNILSDRKGNVNYYVIKQGVDDSGESFHFEIQQLVLRNIRFNTSLENNGFYWFADMTEVAASGNFGQDKFDLQVDAEFNTRELRSGSTRWIQEKPCELSCGLKIDKSKSEYLFSEGEVQIAQTRLGVSGGLVVPDQGADLNLILEGKDLDIASFISLLPEEYSKYTSDYKSEGSFFARAELKGPWNDNENPRVKIDFGIQNGTVIYTPKDVALREVELKGEFSNGQRRALKTSSLKLKEFKFIMDEGESRGNLILTDFEELLIDTRFTSELDLSEVQSFFPEGKLKELEGKASLNMKLSGALAGILNKEGFEKRRPDASGSIQISGVSFRIEGDTLGYRNLNSRIRFNREDVLIEQLSGNAGSTDFKADGKLENFFGYLLSDHQPIGVAAHVQSRQINLDELVSKSGTSDSGDDAYNLKLSPRLVLKLNMRVEKINFRRFAASGISGNLEMRNEILKAKNVVFRTMGGNVSLDAQVDGRKKNDLVLECGGKLNNIDIRQLFYQFENFGQEVITEKHISGSLKADVELKLFMDSTLRTDSKRLESIVDIELKEGRLMNFEPFKNLSRFISLEELNDVKFSTLKNTIEIKDEKVKIPRMEITSSALDMFVSGNHRFDNVIDYHFQLTLSDLLSRKAKKAKKENEEFGEVSDDGLGRTQLFLSMSGAVDNPKISYDSRGAKEKMKADIREEKKELKQLLKKEFGLFKKDTTLDKGNTEKKKKPGVIIEFDE